MHGPEAEADEAFVTGQVEDEGGADDGEGEGGGEDEEVFVGEGGVDVEDSQEDDASHEDAHATTELGFGVGGDEPSGDDGEEAAGEELVNGNEEDGGEGKAGEHRFAPRGEFEFEAFHRRGLSRQAGC